MLRPLCLSLLLAAPALAQEDEFDPYAFEAGSEARSWNLYAEVPARFEARVVDVLCELSGDCPEDCGSGTRQLGLLRAADGQLVLPNKNGQPAFTGAAVELQPFCGLDVEVDGLLLDDPDLGARNIYQLQRIRETGAEEWTEADRWTEVWAENHPDAMGEGPWFRNDPRVEAVIEEEGYLGLGPEAEEAFLRELFAE